jgi:KaiC/GvpD/RAD55 family RecA-like ATPase
VRPSAFALTAPGKLRIYSMAELLLMPPPEWLIHGIMPAGGLIGLYGPPGIGKSFLAIDFAMSIGSGGYWQARPVVRGPVLYIGAEGGTGVSKRAKAWLLDRGVKSRDAKVMWLLESLPIHGDSADVDRVMDRLTEEVNIHPSLVIIDTLARCFDGDENQQEDMGRFVAGADRFRTEFDATVIVVHHTRLDGERERGNTAFRGAADTMMSMKREKGHLWLTCNKQKDSEEFAAIELKLKPVPETESCVILPTRTVRVQAKTDRIIEILRKNKALSPLAWEQACGSTGISRSTFKRRVVDLKESGEIIKKNGKYQISEVHDFKKS